MEVREGEEEGLRLGRLLPERWLLGEAVLEREGEEVTLGEGVVLGLGGRVREGRGEAVGWGLSVRVALGRGEEVEDLVLVEEPVGRGEGLGSAVPCRLRVAVTVRVEVAVGREVALPGSARDTVRVEEGEAVALEVLLLLWDTLELLVEVEERVEEMEVGRGGGPAS